MVLTNGTHPLAASPAAIPMTFCSAIPTLTYRLAAGPKSTLVKSPVSVSRQIRRSCVAIGVTTASRHSFRVSRPPRPGRTAPPAWSLICFLAVTGERTSQHARGECHVVTAGIGGDEGNSAAFLRLGDQHARTAGRPRGI